VLIVNSVLGDASGGRWQVVCDYSRLLQRQGHDVLMLLGNALSDTAAGIPAGVKVQRVHNHGHYDWLAAWRLARHLRPRQPAIALAHCSRSVALLKRALGRAAPVLAVTHSTRVRRLLRADAVIALTDGLRDAIRAEAAGSRKPVYVVPNCVHLPSVGGPSRRVVREPPVIGALGRFDAVKGFDIFVDALGRLAEQRVSFQARLVGAGEQEGRLRERIRMLGLDGQVILSGWIPPESVHGFLSDVDLLCVPARSDAFGLTPLQGAAAGAALVLSRASGHCAMFAEDSEALFFDVGDVGGLAARIRQLLGDPERRKQLSAAAFERVSRCYNEDAVTRGVLNAINNTLLLQNKT